MTTVIVNAVNEDVRHKIVVGAVDMIRRRGLTAMSVRELAKEAGTPLGSTYHYFPNGKQQVAEEAVRYLGSRMLTNLEEEFGKGPVEALRGWMQLWGDVVARSGFRAGCPVMAVAVEEPPAEGSPLLRAAADVFDSWRQALAASLREHGVEDAHAGRLATMVIASVEGALAMCRARGDLQPLQDVGAELEAMLEAAIS